MESPTVELVVFDLAGTTVDHGCMAPVIAIVDLFSELGITVTHRQARGPMGVHKRDHVRALLKLDEIGSQWHQRYGDAWTEADVERIYEALIPRQQEVAAGYADIIHEAAGCLTELRGSGVKIAATTGYPRVIAQPILERMAQQGIEFHSSVCADEVPRGRPEPWMIFRNMEKLRIFPPRSVVKVGDTVPDVQAGRNAGVWAVGVTETGSEFGLSSAELEALPADERSDKGRAAEAVLREAGAHEVIRNLSGLPALLPSWGQQPSDVQAP